jgi:hypothetical protein
MDHSDQPSLFSADELPARRDEAWELPDTGDIPQSEEGLGIAASLQMELSAKCMRFIAALRDVGVNPALSFRQTLIGHMTLLSNNLQLLTAGAVRRDEAPEVVAETRRAWELMNELRMDLLASLPSGPARAVLEREAELADIPLEEIDDGAEDDEGLDSEYEDTSWIDEVLGRRLEQMLRENHERRPLPPSLRHRALLKALPVEWLDAICETVDIRNRRLRKDREKALISVLTDPDGLEEVLYQLAPEEIDALRFLLEHDGASKVVRVTRRFGEDSGDSHFWSENPPASVLGQLRVRGLVFVGHMVHDKQNCRTAAIPVELRQPIAAALEDLEPGEMDPDAELRSVHRTVAAWCEGAFPASGEPAFIDEERELAVDIVHSVANLMADFQEELPHQWTASALMDCLTEDVPRKISADNDWFDAIPGAMCALLEHAADAGELEQGRELARVIRSRADEIQRASRDPMRWGMAKTVLMAALDEDVDPTDHHAMGDFIERWNERVAPPPEPRRSTKIGRNQPCPCGSGKKYKRCCGG